MCRAAMSMAGKGLTGAGCDAIIKKINTAKTVEAEIKTGMRAQRVREAESRIEKQSVKWTAEGTGKGSSRVFCDVKAYVSCRRYAGISLRARVIP